VSKASPQAAPALLTRMSSLSSRAANAAARPFTPSILETSAGSAEHGPAAPSSAAVASQASAWRDEMQARAPWAMKPAAIIRPMPRYEQMLSRFADFNAGHFACRNAAFQNAASLASGIPLELDGNLVVRGDPAQPGSTELAVRTLGPRLGLSDGAIRSALEQDDGPELEKTRTYARVFELAEQRDRRPVPRAVVPRIRLQGPKISRALTTEWFARRVEDRYRSCLSKVERGRSAS